MTKYRQKAPLVDAFQFGVDRPPMWWKQSIDAGAAKVHTWKFNSVTKRAGIVILPGKDLWAQHGYWIVRHESGDLTVYSPEVFEAIYEPLLRVAA